MFVNYLLDILRILSEYKKATNAPKIASSQGNFAPGGQTILEMQEYFYNYLLKKIPDSEKTESMNEYMEYLRKQIISKKKFSSKPEHFALNQIFSFFPKGFDFHFDYENIEIVAYDKDNIISSKIIIPSSDIILSISFTKIFVKLLELEIEITDLNKCETIIEQLKDIAKDKFKVVEIIIEPCYKQIKNGIEPLLIDSNVEYKKILRNQNNHNQNNNQNSPKMNLSNNIEQEQLEKDNNSENVDEEPYDNQIIQIDDNDKERQLLMKKQKEEELKLLLIKQQQEREREQQMQLQRQNETLIKQQQLERQQKLLLLKKQQQERQKQQLLINQKQQKIQQNQMIKSQIAFQQQQQISEEQIQKQPQLQSQLQEQKLSQSQMKKQPEHLVQSKLQQQKPIIRHQIPRTQQNKNIKNTKKATPIENVSNKVSQIPKSKVDDLKIPRDNVRRNSKGSINNKNNTLINPNNYYNLPLMQRQYSGGPSNQGVINIKDLNLKNMSYNEAFNKVNNLNYTNYNITSPYLSNNGYISKNNNQQNYYVMNNNKYEKSNNNNGFHLFNDTEN